MVKTKINYEVRPAHFGEDANTILSLWLEGFEDFEATNAEKKLAWMYIDNPAGEGLAYLLWGNDDEAIGVQCLGVRKWRCGRTEFKSGIMADFAVGQKHRSLGPALQLLKGVISEGKNVLDIIYGFPNKKAQPVFKRAGYKEFGKLVRYAKVLRSRRYLKRKVPGWIAYLGALFVDRLIRAHCACRVLLACSGVKGVWCEVFDERFDQLWETSQDAAELASNRSSKVLTWYFESNARENNWKIFTIKNNNQEMLGYIVVKIIENVAVIGDFYAKNSGKAFQQLFCLFCKQAMTLGCESISLEFFGAQRVVTQLNQMGFRARDDNAIYYLPCHDQLESSKEYDWYITGYDRDT